MNVLVEPRVGAVVDLRAYAPGTEASSDWLEGRKAPVFADAAAQVAAHAPRGSGQVKALAADEFVIVLAGNLDIRSGDKTLHVSSGQSCVLPVGCDFMWRAGEETLLVIARAPARAAGTCGAPVLIDESALLVPSNPPLADLLIGATPSCRNHSDYWSDNREFVCGTWDSTPYHRKQMPYRHIELMHLLEGSITFYDQNGRITHHAGDIILFVRGEGCAWLSEEHVKKVYANHRPTA